MKNYANKSNEAGYLMIGALGLITAIAILSANMNVSINNAVKATSTVNLVNSRYYEVEKAISEVNNWLQENNEAFGAYFDEDNFVTTFGVRTTENVLGTNEVINFGVPSRIKVGSSGNVTPLISNNTEFGTSNFPTLDGFNPVTSFTTAFPNASNGGVNMKLTLIWAENDGDGGYNPVFRIDAITGNNPDRGIHLYSNIIGNFAKEEYAEEIGDGDAADPDVNFQRDSVNFFGRNAITLGGSSTCRSASFTYVGAAWVRGADSSNCIMSSTTGVTLSGSGFKIYGGVYSPVAIPAASIAKITNNNALAAECPTGGCSGIHNPLLVWDRDGNGTVNTTDYSWSSYCPNNGTKVCPVGASAGTTNPNNCDITVPANTTFNLPAGCYDTVSVANKGNLRFNSLNFDTIDATMMGKDGDASNFTRADTLLSMLPNPHNKAIYIRSLSLSGGQAAVSINPGVGDDGKFNDVYVEIWNGNINGGQLINTSSAPYKLRLALGSGNTLNGNALLRAHIIAPFQNSTINTLGTFDFYGSLKAHTLSATGSGKLFSDGTGGNITTLPAHQAKYSSTPVEPVEVYSLTFDTYKISQKFR